MLPLNFLIIGAQKSASTFLHECLRDHPDVFMPRYETSFFEDPDYQYNDISELTELLAPGQGFKAIGIKRPDYLARPECPPRLKMHVPQAKLFVVLRNPVDRLLSAYYWYMQVGIVPIRPLAEGVHALLTGEYAQSYPKSQEIIDYGFYAEHLQRYLANFNRDQLFITFHKELRQRPLEIVAQAYEFLGIDPHYRPQALGRKPKQAIYALPRVRFLATANRQFFYDYNVYNGNQLALQPKKGEFTKNIYRACVALDRFVLANWFANEKPRLEPSLRGKLEALYAADIAQLERLLGVDLAHWRVNA